MELGPGVHRIGARAEGHASADESVTVVSGERDKKVKLALFGAWGPPPRFRGLVYAGTSCPEVQELVPDRARRDPGGAAVHAAPAPLRRGRCPSRSRRRATM